MTNVMRQLIACILLSGLVLHTAQAQNYVLQESSVGGAGGTTSNTSYQLTSAAGQVSPAGQQSNDNYTLYSGYPSPDLGFVALLVRFTQELSDAVPVGEALAINGVEVINRVDEVERVTLFYRTGGEASFSEVDLEQVEGAYQGSIPAEAITDRGVAFYVGAEDAEGNTARAPSDGVLSFPVRVPDEGITKSSAQPSGSTQSDYRLVSVPMSADNAAPSAVLEDDLGEYDDTEWRFFEGARADGERGAEFGSTAEMTPGRAFWLIVRNASDPIDTGAGEVLPIDEPYEVDLREGWNYVANPYNFPLPVANVQVNGTPIDFEERQLYEYDGSWAPITSENATLPPFSGFAINSEGDDVLAFDPAPAEAPASEAQSKMLAENAGSDWSWSIGISARTGSVADRHHTAAVAADAKDGADAMDWPEPPTPGRQLAVSFERSDWASPHARYLVDVRSEPSRGATWDFTVRTAERDPVALSFERVAQVPDNFEVWLLDEYNKASQDLRTTPRYTIEDVVAGQDRSMRLIVGSSEYVRQELESAGALPASYELADIYPNPTPGPATIRYGLPKEQAVTMTVYNVLGQKVATLMQDRSMDPGFHTIQWQGGTSSGAPVASGVYFVRMRAGDFTASKKIVRVN